MKYLSLFSGIGGFELGIKQAYENSKVRPLQSMLVRPKDSVNTKGRGDRPEPDCIGFSEIDKYATQIYKSHFNHKEYGDITKITTLPDFDLLVGGFPCQAFSIAGKRMGFDDTRGTLFFEIARILRDKKPKLLLLENVKGLLSHDNQRTFETILCTLSELGYSVEWQVLNSKNFGVPQNRERVFIVGHLGGFPSRNVFPLFGQGGQNTTLGKSTETAVARTLTGGGNTGGNHSGMTILKTHSLFPRSSKSGKGGTGHLSKEDDSAYCVDTGNSQAVERVPLKFLKRNQKNIEGDYAFTVDSMNTGGVKVDSRIRRLTPTECERLQGFPDGWTAEGVEGAMSDTQRYKTLGNAVTVNVIQAIMEKLLLSL